MNACVMRVGHDNSRSVSRSMTRSWFRSKSWSVSGSWSESWSGSESDSGSVTECWYIPRSRSMSVSGSDEEE